MERLTEDALRQEDTCRGCGREKEMGNLIVCWRCFKHPEHPFKYFNGTIGMWLKMYGVTP